MWRFRRLLSGRLLVGAFGLLNLRRGTRAFGHPFLLERILSLFGLPFLLRRIPLILRSGPPPPPEHEQCHPGSQGQHQVQDLGKAPRPHIDRLVAAGEFEEELPGKVKEGIEQERGARKGQAPAHKPDDKEEKESVAKTHCLGSKA